MNREPNTEYILSLSYGKDSLACLEAIRLLDWPLDRIVHAEVWATDDIPADLPPMVEFKKKADQIIFERYGIEVEHVCRRVRERERESYERIFYREYFCKKEQRNRIMGFPIRKGQWCTSELKSRVLNRIGSNDMNIVRYLGVAANEPARIERHSKPGFMLPLVEIGWDEAYCRKWCEENGLLSPIYSAATRGGCWFCHNQSVDQLRLLRKEYPNLWETMLKWDLDSPVTFRSDGRTVHDFDRRFALEDTGLIKSGDRAFRWRKIEEIERQSISSKTH